MKLTTDKPLIVYHDEFDESYKFCGVIHFKTYYNYGSETPILFTENIEIARKVVERLNKQLYD